MSTFIGTANPNASEASRTLAKQYVDAVAALPGPAPHGWVCETHNDRPATHVWVEVGKVVHVVFGLCDPCAEEPLNSADFDGCEGIALPFSG